MPIYKEKGSKDGRQKYRVVINYTDSMGNYKQLVRRVYGSVEAKTTERALSEQVKASAPANTMTVHALFDRYIAAQRSEVRATTLDKASRILARHVLPTMGEKSLARLTPAVMQTWKNEIAAKDLSVTMKNNIFTAFRALLNFGVKIELLPKNPLSVLGGFRNAEMFEKPQDALHYYTPEAFQKYIGIAETTATTYVDWCCYVFFCIAYYTGMRKGEINALKWSDIDGNLIHVRRSIAQKLKGQPYLETAPKNKSSYRDIQAPAPLLAVLAAHRSRQQAFPAFSEDWRVCGGEKPLGDTTIENHNKAYASAAGLEHIRIHDFRHSHASLLVNHGINIQEVARRLGHSNVQITWNTYSHLYPREEERAVAVLDTIPCTNCVRIL